MNLESINLEEDMLLVDKPKGWTSFDVVAKVRSHLTKKIRASHSGNLAICPTLQQKGSCKCKLKVGHTGTLDPEATGLLVLAIGKATKDIQNLIKLDKVYEVEANLGATSTTGDSEGEIKECLSKVDDVSIGAVKDVLNSFVGDIEQIPPKYSAIKVNGVRAYKLARDGKEFELKSRQVNIEYIKDIEFDYPVLKFSCKVSSGTYIRSLVEDIGDKLSTGAYMSGLRRIEIGDFNIENAISVDQQ